MTCESARYMIPLIKTTKIQNQTVFSILFFWICEREKYDQALTAAVREAAAAVRAADAAEIAAAFSASATLSAFSF